MQMTPQIGPTKGIEMQTFHNSFMYLVADSNAKKSQIRLRERPLYSKQNDGLYNESGVPAGNSKV